MKGDSEVSPAAGKPAPAASLVNVPRLVTAYFTERPDAGADRERVAFGTSGHRGSSFRRAFNEDHILAITQAVCEHRANQGIDGPLYCGADTHALSEPALASAIQVLAANQVVIALDRDAGFTPTPAISHAILVHNAGRSTNLADGIVITPSHNPPEDGGFKYNPPTGGPADEATTGWIQDRANAILAGGLREVRRLSSREALATAGVRPHDYRASYVGDLPQVVDLEAIRAAGLRIGVDPLGGASHAYWPAIGERFDLDLTVVNDELDPAFRFMTLDRDGRIRMDCSSPYAMARLIGLADRFDVAFANDPDADRHGIVAPDHGLLSPNQYLAVAVWYLFRHRPGWPADAMVGKTAVTSALVDRVAADLGRPLYEVPPGFKWFVGGLLEGSLGFGGEESAGASFLRRDGRPWTTDKDGLILCLLAAEITARTGRNPGELYTELTERLGRPVSARIDAPATAQQKRLLARLGPDGLRASTLAGEPIVDRLTVAPGNRAPVGGLKAVTPAGWFAARPSGTEDIYRIYAESFRGEEHLGRILEEAQHLVDEAISGD